MFGENESESPRTPSPWISRCVNQTTPLQLLTPPATPPLTLLPPSSISPSSSSPTVSSSSPTSSSPSSSSAASCSPSASPEPTTPRHLENHCRLLTDELDSISLTSSSITNSRIHLPTSSPNIEPPPPPLLIVESVHLSPISTDQLPPSLSPEIDSFGNIEYKYKLSFPTSLHRLERLRTQLKWRLVQGGGKAVYELGVLDLGELCGLELDEMRESLRTLERMLKGLGGGTVRITRVIRLVDMEQEKGKRDLVEEEEKFESPFQQVVNVEEGQENELDSIFTPIIPSIIATTSSTTSTTTLPIDINHGNTDVEKKGPTPFPSNRTALEQAEFKRTKRDARRYKREQEAIWVQQEMIRHAALQEEEEQRKKEEEEDLATIAGTTKGVKRTPFNSHPPPILPRYKPPRPPKPPRRRKVQAREEREEERRLKRERERERNGDGYERGGVGGKPSLRLRRGETRWVVEALVEKRTSAGGGSARRESVGKKERRARGASDASEEGIPSFLGGSEDETEEGESSETGRGESEDNPDELGEVEEEEGWNFLTFDLKDLSTSVKAAAAAAAAATIPTTN
ncbi:hypothetical protein JCM16303_000663 [Sporobolomyces ruberrimus]